MLPPIDIDNNLSPTYQATLTKKLPEGLSSFQGQRATRKNVGRLGQVTETTKNKWTEIKLAKLHSGLDV